MLTYLVDHYRFHCRLVRARDPAGVQHLGFLLTTVLGIAGSMGRLDGRSFQSQAPGSAFHPAGFIMSVTCRARSGLGGNGAARSLTKNRDFAEDDEVSSPRLRDSF